uniref:Uncharacterized protein n=2 Tax=Ciona savignyi TaxID=51511 RepID=H2YR83_CIOSA
MQRSNNGGGNLPGSGLWPAPDMGVGAASKAYGGQPIYRYAINPNTPAPSHYKTGWGDPENPQHPAWSNSTSSGQSSTDQNRSFLGTEQWGREFRGSNMGYRTQLPRNKAHPPSHEPQIKGDLPVMSPTLGYQADSPQFTKALGLIFRRKNREIPHLHKVDR